MYSMENINFERGPKGTVKVYFTNLQVKVYFTKGGFPLSRNFYIRTDVNFNWLYMHKLK